jgi:hypothetical protein
LRKTQNRTSKGLREEEEEEDNTHTMSKFENVLKAQKVRNNNE